MVEFIERVALTVFWGVVLFAPAIALGALEWYSGHRISMWYYTAQPLWIFGLLLYVTVHSGPNTR